MSTARVWFRRGDDVAWRVVLFFIFLPLLLVAVLWCASLLSDSSRIPAALAAAAQESGVMVCSEGTIVHGSGAPAARLVSEGRFQCTAWRMRGKEPDPRTGGAVDWPSSPRR